MSARGLFFLKERALKQGCSTANEVDFPLFCGGTGGGNPGENGAGSVREKRTGSGIPRWREEGEIRGNHSSLRNILQSKNGKEVGANKNDAGTWI